MKRRPKSPGSEEKSSVPAAEDASAILQVKVWLLDISPMVWRRLLVPSNYTLRELHGVIQVGRASTSMILSCVPRVTGPGNYRPLRQT
jgi:hypothetical protein